MNHFLLKFNHGVEIGARMAYLGHLKRTGNGMIWRIAQDEREHRHALRLMLNLLGHKPHPWINGAFYTIGLGIYMACAIMPMWSLNLVARTMELFAVVNYSRLAEMYPQFRESLLEMAETEKEHERYFR